MKLYCLSGHPTLPCNVLKFKSTTIMLDCGLDMTSTLSFLPLPLVQSPRLSNLPGWSLKDGNAFLDKELKECSGHVFVDSVPEFCLPETELIDLSTVDVILISNYHCMMALPYITEHTGFTGTVYATEPTVQIGRLLMEELVNFIERVPKAQSASLWKNKDVQRLLPAPLKDAVEVSTWRRCYTMQEVNSALSKIQLVGYSQKIELFGAVQVTPLSSGYALGSSNWIIQSHYEKVSYVSGSSLLTTHPQPSRHCHEMLSNPEPGESQEKPRDESQPWRNKARHPHRNRGQKQTDPRSKGPAGTSHMTYQLTELFQTHERSLNEPMDQASLKNSDVLILTGLTQIPTANPDGMVGEFCSNLALTVRNGGNVLVPCYPSGVIYDLLECLYQYIDSAGLSSVPFYFISPVANSSLEFSQIFAEWLCHNKQSKVYLPEPPFPHAELIQTNKLKHYPSIHGDFSNDFRQPCVVFTGHPSLRFGDVVHFMELWGKSSLNTVIFTEPDFSYLEALAPYQPLAMKCIYCPIDTRLNFIQVSKLLKEVQNL
ncbi:integrator complex subunit 9 isoform X5 [Tamandua tetradactyla]|uniref:integrator complex subunit 9 isoform X5 n=1 Tax=Tamandua tetradactyla TaxID=48850 RepID=UPI00405442A8